MNSHLGVPFRSQQAVTTWFVPQNRGFQGENHDFQGNNLDFLLKNRHFHIKTHVGWQVCPEIINFHQFSIHESSFSIEESSFTYVKAHSPRHRQENGSRDLLWSCWAILVFRAHLQNPSFFLTHNSSCALHNSSFEYQIHHLFSRIPPSNSEALHLHFNHF